MSMQRNEIFTGVPMYIYIFTIFCKLNKPIKIRHVIAVYGFNIVSYGKICFDR